MCLSAGSLAAIAALAMGCGTATTSSPPSAMSGPPSPSPTPTLVPSPTVVPIPSSAASPLALCAKDFTPCPVAAGTYSTAPFIHPFLVTIGDGWTNDRNWPHGGELASGGSAGVLEWGSGFIGGTGPAGKAVAIKPTSDALLAYIRSFGGFTVSPQVPIAIGGRTGRSVDVSTNQTQAEGLLDIPEDSYNLGPGEKVRLMVFDLNGSAVMIMVEVPMANGFDDAMAAMGPVLNSIAWQ
jgi:hypothetical protein